MTMGRSMTMLTRLAAAATVAAASTTASPAPAQPPKAEARPPREAAKMEVRIDFAPVPAPAQARPADAVEVRGRVATVPAAGADLGAMTRQVIQQYRPRLRAELRVLTSAADPTPAQRREIAIEGGRAVKDAARKMAEFQRGVMMNGRRVEATDLRKAMRDSLTAAAEARLSPEQFGRYRQELERRDREQRLAVTLNVVANLDRLLILSPEQRDRLCDSLLAHWDDTTYPTLEALVAYDQYHPALPEPAIAPILDEAQRLTWKGAQKIGFGSMRNSNFFVNNGMVEEPGDDVEEADLKAALAEEEKK